MSPKYLLLILFLFLNCSPAFCQTTAPDFRKELRNAATDSQRLSVYIDVDDYYSNSNNDSIKAYINEGLQTFTRHGYKHGKGVLLLMLSGVYGEEGLPRAALSAAEEGLKIFTELKDGTHIAKAHNSAGVVEAHNGRYVKAYKHFLAARKHFEQTADTPNIINTYVKLGAVNDYNGNFDRALAYYHNALNMSLRTEESANTIYLYTNIGISHARNGKFDTALHYFEQAEMLSRKPNLAKARISPLTNIGKIYTEKGDNKTALEYFYKAMVLAKDLKMQEDYGRMLFEIGMLESETNPKSMASLEEALKVAKEIDNKVMQTQVLEGMAEMAHKHGKYKDEVSYLRQGRVIQDSVFNIRKAKELANLQAEYELTQTSAQLEALRKSDQENQQKKDLIIAIAIILAITLLTLLFFFVKSKKLNKELSVREQDLKKANNVKDRLFSIIGHDLKGPIGNIPALLSIYKSEDSSEDEKKFILESLEENAVASMETLEKLLSWGKQQIKGNTFTQSAFNVDTIMQNKIKLIGVTATNKNVTVVNNVSPETQVFADENQFKFVLRNLLSNAVKYTHPGGRVEIYSEDNADTSFTTFSIKDNGVGIDKDRQAHIFEPYNESTVGTANELGTSIGLMLCREFIIQNGGNIWVKSEKGEGTTFSFTVKSGNPGNN